MTAPAQIAREPEQRLAKAIEGVSERLLVGVLKGELLSAYAHAESAERKLAEAVAALRKYGQHKYSCEHGGYSFWGPTSCTCGFDEATK